MSTKAKTFNSESAREEAKKYSRPILLREITTKNGKATVNDVKMAALSLRLSRKSKKPAGRAPQRPTAPSRTYGNVPLSQQKPPQRPAAPQRTTTKKSTFYIAPVAEMRLKEEFDEVKKLAAWYTDEINDIKMRSTISDIEFNATAFKTKMAIRVKVEYEDPRGFELDYIKDLITREIGDDYNKMVIVRDGEIVMSMPGREVFVRTRVL